MIRGFLQGDDCLATVACMRALGADLVLDEAGTLRVRGAGLRGLREPATVLDAQNSGHDEAAADEGQEPESQTIWPRGMPCAICSDLPVTGSIFQKAPGPRA